MERAKLMALFICLYEKFIVILHLEKEKEVLLYV